MQGQLFRTSTKSHIKTYLKSNSFRYVSGSELERQADTWQTKPSVISRRARELANEGVIQRRINQRGAVEYHA